MGAFLGFLLGTSNKKSLSQPQLQLLCVGQDCLVWSRVCTPAEQHCHSQHHHNNDTKPEFLGPNSSGPNIVLDFCCDLVSKGLRTQFLEHKFF